MDGKQSVFASSNQQSKHSRKHKLQHLRKKVPHKSYNNSKSSAKEETIITNEPNNHNMNHTIKSNGIDVLGASKYFRKEF